MNKILLAILQNLFNKKYISSNDALLDNRPQSDKDKNFLDIEFSMGVDDYEWKEEDLNNIQGDDLYPHNQSSSLSCVSLAPAIWLQTFKGFIGSRKDVYSRRFNFPSGGMAGYDMIKIGKEGLASEQQVPSQGLGETAMNASYPITADILKTRSENKIKDGIYVKGFNDIDNLAKASKNSPVSLFVFFSNFYQWQEFWKPFPTVNDKALKSYDSGSARHQITELGLKVLGGVLINGVKHIKVQDSAGVGTGLGRNKNIRYLSEEFVKYRVYEAIFALPDVVVVVPPSNLAWTGKRNLKVGMVGDDVKRLQEILQKEGCFDYPNPTGYFGGITRGAVIKLQNKYKSEILTPSGLTSGTGFVGNSTRAWLEKNYK